MHGDAHGSRGHHLDIGACGLSLLTRAGVEQRQLVAVDSGDQTDEVVGARPCARWW